MHPLEEDKQETLKQLGCINGLFRLFDRRYLLRQRLHGHYHKKLHQGQSFTGNKFNNASDKLKDQDPNKIMKEKHRESVESSRSSFSSSCSSLDCSKLVQTDSSSICRSMFSELSSPPSNKKQHLWEQPADIRDVVKDSMTRKPRLVLVKTVAKDERKGPKMTHVDSPRLLQQHPKPIAYERKDQNLARLKETCIPILRGVEEAKQTLRFSYDDHESPYKLKSYANIKDHPRLSLDSKQSSIKHNANVIDQSQNKTPPSSVVARLMGLEANSEALKVNALTRIPVEPAPWKQEVKQPVNKKDKQRADHACQSVNDQTEAIQRTKMKLENTQLHKSAIKPTNLTSDSMVITSLQKVKRVNPCRGHERNSTPTATKAIARTKKQMSPSHITNGSRVSPRHQKSKIRKQSNGYLTITNSKTGVQSYRDTCHIRNLSEQSDRVSYPSESDASVVSQNKPEVNNKNKFAEKLMGYKPMVEQPSPVSVLDAFYTKDTPSPIKKKSYAYKDEEDSCFDEKKWSHIHHIELSKSTIDEATINRHEGMNKHDIYIKEMLSASGFMKNLDFAPSLVNLHPTDTLINPELFNILEKTDERASESEKIKRKLIFDTVNNILVQKLLTSKRKGRHIDGKKLLEELCLEINNLHDNQAGDPYDNLINIKTADVNNKSRHWDDYCNEIPTLVFDIEQFILNDLITENMNSEAWSPQ